MRGLLIFFALCGALLGQGSTSGVVFVKTLPATCSVPQVFNFGGALYTCPSGVPVAVGGGGGGSGISGLTANCIPKAATSTTIASCAAVTDNGTTVASTEPVSAPSLALGAGSSASGYQLWSGAASGSSGFSVANAAGTSVLYLMPIAPSGTSTQFLQDTGSATCPTLPSGAPGLCHQLAWATASGGSGITTLSTVASGSPTSLSISSIPAGNLLTFTFLGRSANAANTDFFICFYNGDATTAHYEGNVSQLTNTGSPSSGSANGSVVAVVTAASSTAGIQSSLNFVMPEFASSTLAKSWSGTGGGYSGATPFTVFFGGAWNASAAVTSIACNLVSGAAFVNGSVLRASVQ